MEMYERNTMRSSMGHMDKQRKRKWRPYLIVFGILVVLGIGFAVLKASGLILASSSGEDNILTQTTPTNKTKPPDDPELTGNYTEITALFVKNDQAIPRIEVAFSSVPISKQLMLKDTIKLGVVRSDGKRIGAQFNVISRWGGVMDDDNLPIRWLQVCLDVDITSNTQHNYSLRIYKDVPTALTRTASITQHSDGFQYIISTGSLNVTIHPSLPVLFSQISLTPSDGSAATIVFDASDSGFAGYSGPRMVLTDTTELTAGTGNVVVDFFEIVETGPLKVVVQSRGHFTHPTHPQVRAVCGNSGEMLNRFGYTVVASMMRDSSDIHLEYHFRNECGEGTGSWTGMCVCECVYLCASVRRMQS